MLGCLFGWLYRLVWGPERRQVTVVGEMSTAVRINDAAYRKVYIQGEYQPLYRPEYMQRSWVQGEEFVIEYNPASRIIEQVRPKTE